MRLRFVGIALDFTPMAAARLDRDKNCPSAATHRSSWRQALPDNSNDSCASMCFPGAQQVGMLAAETVGSVSRFGNHPGLTVKGIEAKKAVFIGYFEGDIALYRNYMNNNM